MRKRKKGLNWMVLLVLLLDAIILAMLSYMTYVFIEKVCIGK